jgi:hypothetical protein
MTTTTAPTMRCHDCRAPLAPRRRGELPPPGHKRHAARGLCSTCHNRRREQGTIDEVAPATLRRPPLDRDVVAQLVRKGLTDRQIAERLDANLGSVGDARRDVGLPANTPPRTLRTPRPSRVPEDRLRELHAAGLLDPAIAAELGVSPNAVHDARKRLGLPSNYRTPAKIDPDEVRRLADEGLTDRAIAARLECAAETVLRTRKRHGIAPGVPQNVGVLDTAVHQRRRRTPAAGSGGVLAALVGPDGAALEGAACVGAGRPGDDRPDPCSNDPRERARAARELCAACPVLLTCELAGRGAPARAFVWGGRDHGEGRTFTEQRGGVRVPALDVQDTHELAS